MNLRLQLLAQAAVAAEPRPTMLVAISPSDGGILAAAQNQAADAQGAIAFNGLHPPGSTFKTITTAAALEAGPADVTAELRMMMRAKVTEGTASELADIADLGGKTGTAAFADNTRSHGWFAGSPVTSRSRRWWSAAIPRRLRSPSPAISCGRKGESGKLSP